MSRFIYVLLLSLLYVAVPAQAATFTTYYHNDHLGSPVAATDASGALLWRAHFRPYGERQEDPKDAAFGTVGYTGHAQDKDSGLVYAGARYMDPVLGRFMAVDPVGFTPSSPVSFNRYAYGNNSPYRFTDPDGRQSQDEAWAELGMPNPSAGLLHGAASIAADASAMGDGVDAMMPHYFSSDSHSIELLATVCKIIEDEKTSDDVVIRQKLQEWKPNRFQDSETYRTISFIKKNKWDQKILQ